MIITENFGIRCEFRTTESWDDFIPLTNRVLDDDLFIIIGARQQSVSYSAEMADIPIFLQRNFSRNNLMMIYPEQFGEAPNIMSFVDPLAGDTGVGASPFTTRFRTFVRGLKAFFRRL